MNSTTVAGRRSIFATQWFDLVAKDVTGDSSPHYSIATRDYVSVLAKTAEGKILLVRQYRPAVEQTTLELPGGHVEQGETPEAAARKELREETGYVAEELHLAGSLSPDTGRLGNQMWCFFAPSIVYDPSPDFVAEEEVEAVLYDRSLRDLVLDEPAFSSALNRAAILMAIAKGFIEL
jgi:ADP-ribose pyrophosphatase